MIVSFFVRVTLCYDFTSKMKHSVLHCSDLRSISVSIVSRPFPYPGTFRIDYIARLHTWSYFKAISGTRRRDSFPTSLQTPKNAEEAGLRGNTDKRQFSRNGKSRRAVPKTSRSTRPRSTISISAVHAGRIERDKSAIGQLRTTSVIPPANARRCNFPAYLERASHFPRRATSSRFCVRLHARVYFGRNCRQRQIAKKPEVKFVFFFLSTASWNNATAYSRIASVIRVRKWISVAQLNSVG